MQRPPDPPAGNPFAATAFVPQNGPPTPFVPPNGSIATPQPMPVAVARVVAAQPVLASTSVSVVCGRCRGVAEPGADFCKFCGNRLNAPLATNVAGAPETPSPRLTPSDARGPSAPRQLEGSPLDVGAASAVAHTPRVINTPSPSAISLPDAPAIAERGAAANDASPLNVATRPLQGIGEATIHARLVRIAKDGSEGSHHPVVADVTDLGRTEGNIVLPDDPYLSPRHARIAVRARGNGSTGARLGIVDLGSVNGVFVRIRAPHPLTHGDLLLLGQQVLRFEAVSEIEGARGPAMQHGVLLFGSPAPMARARVVQRTVEGLARDVMYLLREEVVMGREAGDRTYPDDVFMSRRHAAIRHEGSGWVLHDLGSSNGTFVQIHAEHALLDGDQFRVGHHLFRVDVPVASGVA